LVARSVPTSGGTPPHARRGEAVAPRERRRISAELPQLALSIAPARDGRALLTRRGRLGVRRGALADRLGEVPRSRGRVVRHDRSSLVLDCRSFRRGSGTHGFLCARYSPPPFSSSLVVRRNPRLRLRTEPSSARSVRTSSSSSPVPARHPTVSRSASPR